MINTHISDKLLDELFKKDGISAKDSFVESTFVRIADAESLDKSADAYADRLLRRMKNFKL